jgi:hypothetical protein
VQKITYIRWEGGGKVLEICQVRTQLDTIGIVFVHQNTKQRLCTTGILNCLGSEPHLALAIASTASIIQVVCCFKVELTI